MATEPRIAMEPADGCWIASGSWTAPHASTLEQNLDALGPDLAGGSAVISLRDVTALDTYGAWLLERLIRRRAAASAATEVVAVPERYRDLLATIHETNRAEQPAPKQEFTLSGTLEKIGRSMVRGTKDLVAIVSMLGAIGSAFAATLANPRTFRFTSTVNQLDRVGLQAVPIIVLITFLIGGIIAQQGFFHFRKFGAELYVVDMLGILILREIGVLIVAIMVAGRSGSSYTAELGSMKMREEIDALRTMGLDPIAVLVLPRIVALVIGLTLLTFIGSMAALYGGGVISWLYGGMSPEIFVARLHEAISTTHFKVGLLKAPFMALVIGAVACAEGFAVKGSAESLGRQTTASVVKSIFLVIVLDGFFAVFFAAIDM